ncbi:hypothetical protein GOBAR_DD30155 [Gossypium barbadense]|nr:hypothetical protein GOBAR_DD30155 [Gossypium barbadense]
MEVKLWNDKREREMYENFAELYAIIKATEKLEKAYVRDIISSSEYETECQKLIAHFKTLASTLKDTVPSIERFADTYKMDCPAAINRLVTSGVPATVEHRAAAAASATTSAAIVAECVQNFITAMDSLKLNMVAVDQVYPLLSDLSASLNKLADELTEQQARQLHFDLESSYNSFMAALPNAEKTAGWSPLSMLITSSKVVDTGADFFYNRLLRSKDVEGDLVQVTVLTGAGYSSRFGI